MKQPYLSIDLSAALDSGDRIESVLKDYYRVWANKDTKDRFIRSDRLNAFNHMITWSIDCRVLNSEISYAFRLLEEQLAKGVTDTKKQEKVKWYIPRDLIMQYYCNDTAYRIRSIWDKLGQIINVYFLNSKYDKKEVSLSKATNAVKQTPHNKLFSLRRNVQSSKTYKDLKSYRDDFTHNLTQELANVYRLHDKFWHTDDLIRLLIDSYKQLAETYDYVLKLVRKDAASTSVTDFKEMLDRTPFFGG